MSKRRGKNRPPVLGARLPGPPPIVMTTCRTCPDIVSKDELQGGQCASCLRIEREAAQDFTVPRSEVARRQFDTGARRRGSLYKAN